MSTQADGTATATHTESTIYRLIKHPIRHKILIRTGERPWCPAEISEDIGEPLKRVCEQVDVLLAHTPPCLELVEERPGPRGGRPRHFYKALARVTVDVDEWLDLSPLEQAQQTVTITEELFKEWTASINNGVFYEDIEHCLMRTAMTLDKEGMQQINREMVDLQARFAEIERESAERRSRTGTPPRRVITGLASFRAAPE